MRNGVITLRFCEVMKERDIFIIGKIHSKMCLKLDPTSRRVNLLSCNFVVTKLLAYVKRCSLRHQP